MILMAMSYLTVMANLCGMNSMKKLFLILSLFLASTVFAGQQGSYPNPNLPLTGLERMLSWQAGHSVEITPQEIIPSYNRTAAEIAAGVTPVNYGYPPGNVLRYGADSTGAADSTAAFTNDLSANTVVNIPAGTFKLSTVSVLQVFGKRLIGAGENATILSFPNETGYAIQVGGTDIAAPALIGFQLEGNANAAGGILLSEAGIGVRRGLFQDVYVTGFTKAGTYAWDIQGNANNGIYYNTFINCAAGGDGPGVDNANGWRLWTTDAPTQPNRVNENTFIQDTADFTAGDGFYVNYASDDNFVGIDREVNSGWGFNLQGQDLAIGISGGDSENNTAGSINIGGAGSDVHVFGGNITEATGGTWTASDQYLPGGIQQSGQFGVEPSGTVTISPFSGSSSALAVTSPATFTNTQMNDPATSLLNGLSPLTEYQAAQGNQYTTDGIIGGVLVPSSATVFQVNGITGYVKNTSSTVAGVGIYGQGRCVASTNGARCWGSNLVSTDVTDAGHSPTVTSTLFGLETDVAPMNSGDGANGQVALINSSLLSNYTANTAFLAGGNYRNQGDKWGFGFETQDAGAVAAFAAGALCLTGSCGSQDIRFYYGGGAGTWIDVSADSSGNLVLPIVKLPPYTVSTLPACNAGNKGDLAYVTDATSPTYNGSLTGGGSVVVSVFCNGTSWTSH